jgi:hypothetical protein
MPKSQEPFLVRLQGQSTGFVHVSPCSCNAEKYHNISEVIPTWVCGRSLLFLDSVASRNQLWLAEHMKRIAMPASTYQEEPTNRVHRHQEPGQTANAEQQRSRQPTSIRCTNRWQDRRSLDITAVGSDQSLRGIAAPDNS